MLINQTKFAEICGITKAAVNQAIKRGSFDGGLVGNQIDLSSEVIRNNLRKRGIDPNTAGVEDLGAEPAKPRKKRSPNKPNDAPMDEALPPSDADPSQFGDMTLNELVDKFGTQERFAKWATARKVLADIRAKELANEQTAGTLVSRDLVKLGIIEPYDTVHIKLLTDGAKTITVRAIAMHAAGKSQMEIEKFVSDKITSFLKPVKGKVARAMKKI